MEKGVNRRSGKVITNHSTQVEGVGKLVSRVSEWVEIEKIILGPVKTGQRGRRRPGLSFRASRPLLRGNQEIGVKCLATHGSANQEISLLGNALAIRNRLRQEGYATY